MAKYQDILVRRIETEKKREKGQEQLREESGIRDTGYYLKEKSWKSCLKDAVKHVCFLAYAALAFIGAGIVLSPESRHIILQIFHLS